MIHHLDYTEDDAVPKPKKNTRKKKTEKEMKEKMEPEAQQKDENK